MNKAISISLFRVSGDSKNLDMIFSCPCEEQDNYYFTSLLLEVRYIHKGTFKSKFFDLSPALFDNDESSESCTKNKTHWTVRLPLDRLGILGPAIYKGTFKALNDEYDILEDVAIASDVNFAYKCMLNDILKESERCEELSDDAIRKYLLLYGHLASLTADDLETAEVYFKLIANCFNTCPTKDRPNKHVSSCNCGK